MKRTKRFLAVFLSIALSFSLFANTYSFAATPDSGFNISNGVLQQYTGTQTNVSVPSGVTEIADNAFANTGVTNVILPDGVTRIGKDAFSDCSSLKSINIPSTVNTIDDGSFFGCKSLASVAIPDSVTTLGQNVFSGAPTFLYGSNSSAAHSYAQSNKINFRETGTKYPILTAPIQGNTPDEKLESAVKGAYSFLNKNMNEFEKAQVMHDYIVLNTKYDYANYESNTLPDSDFAAYGVLVNHVGVCAGYASAYALLMDLLGIQTYVVTSDTHAWDLVKLDGNWYHIDTTWDDPVPDRPGITSYDYFILSDSKMKTFSDHQSWNSYLPAASDTKFDSTFWGAYTHEDFNKLETPVISSVSLDTSSYKGTSGSSYRFLAKTNLGEFVYAKAGDSSIVQVGEPELNLSSNDWVIPITGLKAGTTTVTAVSASGATTSFPVTFTNNFVSDTNGSFSVLSGNTYQFTITAPSRPNFACGSGSFKIVSSTHSGNKYYYKVQAIGNAGQSSGFYVNGSFISMATIVAPSASSDTNGSFSVTAGNTYQFMITSSARPNFACGSPSFQIVSSSNSGSHYCYRVQAIGNAGQGCGFYVNGKSVATATISSPVSHSDTNGKFAVKKGNTYQLMVTSTGRPSFACGSGSFQVVSSCASGNKYYFKIQATGKVGDSSGIYLDGKAVAVATVA